MEVNQNLQKKPTKRWIVLIVLPYAMLIFVAIVQFIVRFIASPSDNPDTASAGDLIVRLVNILGILAGMASVILILLTPVWIILLINASNYNKSR